MEDYYFTIEHRPGTRHGNADALSRRPCPKKDCLIRSRPPRFSPDDCTTTGSDDDASQSLEHGHYRDVPQTIQDTPNYVRNTASSLLFSGPADYLDYSDDVTERNAQLSQCTGDTQCTTQGVVGHVRHTTSPTHFSGRPRPRRLRNWRPAQPPSLETIMKEDTGIGDFSETPLNPLAAPYLPVSSVLTAAILVESPTAEDAVTPDPAATQPAAEDQPPLPWSHEGLIAAQKEDISLGHIYQLISAGIEKPAWNDIVQQSAEVKTLWSFWPRLQIRDGLLQRKFVSEEQQTEYWQTAMPKPFREEFIEVCL